MCVDVLMGQLYYFIEFKLDGSAIKSNNQNSIQKLLNQIYGEGPFNEGVPRDCLY